MKYGRVDNFSAFVYENYMQFFKKILRYKNNQIEQIVKRVSEYENYELDFEPVGSKRLDFIGKKKVKLHNYIVSSSKGNNVFLLVIID